LPSIIFIALRITLISLHIELLAYLSSPDEPLTVPGETAKRNKRKDS